MMRSMNMRILFVLLVFSLAVMATGTAWAEVIDSQEPEVINIVINKSTVINTSIRATRITLASPGFVDMVLLSPSQIYLTAKALGSTTLTLWAGKKVAAVYDVVVTPDLTRLKRMIHEIMPNEKNIRVLSSGSSITLSGHVSNAANMGRVMDLANAQAPGHVVNLMTVDGIHQVMLEVRIAEMSRSVTKELGVNLAAIGSNFAVFSLITGLPGYGASIGATASGSFGVVGRTSLGSYNLSGVLQALKENDLIRVLAEPNLTCVSGESAEFLVGGEVPIPMPGSLGTVSINYKPYGIGLKFTPTVLSSGRINLHVAPEVSELDYSRSVPVQGYEVPTITTRRADTVVELGDGQSFMIAGLISDSFRENVDKVPGLGDIPILGNLFSSKEYESNKSELVVLVTAHLAKPIDMNNQTLPTDGFKEPDDVEFFLLGLTEGRGGYDPGDKPGKKPENVSQPGAVIRPENGFDGEFGHSWPR